MEIVEIWGLHLPAQESPEYLKCHVTGNNNSKAEFGKNSLKTMVFNVKVVTARENLIVKKMSCVTVSCL